AASGEHVREDPEVHPERQARGDHRERPDRQPGSAADQLRTGIRGGGDRYAVPAGCLGRQPVQRDARPGALLRTRRDEHRGTPAPRVLVLAGASMEGAEEPAARAREERRRHSYAVSVAWTGSLGTGTSGYTAYSRNHEITAEGRPPLACSSDPSFRG